MTASQAAKKLTAELAELDRAIAKASRPQTQEQIAAYDRLLEARGSVQSRLKRLRNATEVE